MTDAYFDTVISMTDARQSALFCEHVIPLVPYDVILSLKQRLEPGTIELIQQRGDIPKIRTTLEQLLDITDKWKRQWLDSYEQVCSDLAPDYLRDNMEYLHAILQINGEVVNAINAPEKLNAPGRVALLIGLLKKFNLSGLLFDTSEEIISNEGGSETEMCTTLASKSIIKVDSLDWEQIMEFRRDKDAKEKNNIAQDQ